MTMPDFDNSPSSPLKPLCPTPASSLYCGLIPVARLLLQHVL